MRRTKKQRQVEAEHLAQRAQRARYASTVREAFNSTVTAVRVAATFADNLPLKTRWERTWTADDKVSFETSCPASRWPGRERCYGGGLNFGAAVLRAVSTGQSVTGR